MAVIPQVDKAAEKPLHGVRILDFTQVLAGPFCTAMLGDMGAEIIKVEPPHGDSYRQIGPFRNGESALFVLNNRNKKSIAIDLKSASGRALAGALSQHCDVVIENFKPGVAKRLGIGFEALSADNPGLVYASISGFGQSGSMADRPAFDLIAQALSGYMDVTGEEDGPPLKVGESIGDLCAGLYAAWSIMVALYARQHTGRGAHVDIAMFDSLFSLLPTALAQWMFSGINPRRVGNRHPLTTPFGVFMAQDGQVVIAVITNSQFEHLTQALGCPGMAADPRFSSDELRTEHEPLLREMLESRLSELKVDDVVDRLLRASVPACAIWSLEQAINSSQVAERSLLAVQQHPRAGEIPLLEQPVHFSGIPRGGQTPAPSLGQHGPQVLCELLGLSREQIERLIAEGVLTKGEPL